MLFPSCLKAIADEAEGDNVLIVTHGDGVNASVTRIWPWAIAHPVLHTGFTVAMREREDGTACYTLLPFCLTPESWLHKAGSPVEPFYCACSPVSSSCWYCCQAFTQFRSELAQCSGGHAYNPLNATNECNSKD